MPSNPLGFIDLTKSSQTRGASDYYGVSPLPEAFSGLCASGEFESGSTNWEAPYGKSRLGVGCGFIPARDYPAACSIAPCSAPNCGPISERSPNG